MTPPFSILECLRKWYDLHLQLSAATLDPVEDDAEQLTRTIGLRQQIVESIRKLDSQTRSISRQRKAGWPGVETGTVQMAETLIQQTLALMVQIVRDDARILHRSREVRGQILESLKNTGVHRNYVSLKSTETEAPSVIVDEHA